MIPFFFKEFAGIEARYLGKQVKACKINMKSSLGFMLRTTLEKADVPAVGDKYYLYLSMFEMEADAKLYNCVSGKKNWLKVPDKVCVKINDILEDQFRIAFVYFVDGMLRANPDITVKDAIQEWMVEYKLDEHDFNLESLRRLHHRMTEGDNKISRLQFKTSNRTKGYKP